MQCIPDFLARRGNGCFPKLPVRIKAPITPRGVRHHVSPLLVGERLYLAGRDIRPVHKSGPPPGIQRNVRRNHIECVEKFNPLIDSIRFPDTSYTWMLLPLGAVLECSCATRKSLFTGSNSTSAPLKN